MGMGKKNFGVGGYMRRQGPKNVFN